MKRITIEDKEEYLRQVSKTVDFNKDDYLKCISKLKEYCSHNAVFALAPVQIGIPKRIIYLKNTTTNMDKNCDFNYDEGIILINPEIVEMKGKTKFLERCESCLDFVGTVERPYMIKMKYYDIDKNEHVEWFEGFICTILAHEYDHLNGILHIDKSINITEMSWEETKRYRELNPYKIISRDCKFKQ